MRTIKTIPALFISILALTACSDSSTDIPADDQFEPNNEITNATPILASTTYEGRQRDEDWFQITVTSGFERVVAVIAFAHASGDINLELYDAGGTTVLAASTTTNDNEQIDFTVSASGTYSLRVFGNNSGNSYDISWNGLPPIPADDQDEENDDFASATPLAEDTAHIGIQLDDDWYQITVQPGFERVVASLVFTNANGDIDLELYDTDGTTVRAASNTTNDNEQIDVPVSAGGSYYLRVFGSNSGNTYTLSWDGTLTDDTYEENDDLASATTLPENTALDGVQLDDDWYRITVLSGSERVTASLTFSNANGDLDLQLYESGVPNALATSDSSSNDFENFVFDVSAGGDYYLKVYNYLGNATGNSYSLTWDGSEPIDDLYEPNNVLATATDLAGNTSISGIQLDEDWYKIDVVPGSQHLVIDLTFLHASGDLDIVLYNSTGAYRASSESSNDNEQIDYTVTSGGTYYLQIYDGTTVGGSTGNTYNLIWTSSP